MEEALVQLIRNAFENDATDVFLMEDEPPRIRREGEITPLHPGPVPRAGHPLTHRDTQVSQRSVQLGQKLFHHLQVLRSGANDQLVPHPRHGALSLQERFDHRDDIRRHPAFEFENFELGLLRVEG